MAMAAERAEPGAVAEVGRLVDSGQADDRRVIRLVRARPVLYARNNMPVASYYSSVKRLWKEVADEMGWTVAEVRRKWSHIRNSYSRHLRNELCGARTGRGRAVSRWYLAAELEFLRDHMATDTRASAYAPRCLSRSKREPMEGLKRESVDLKSFVDGPWLALAAAGSRCKREPPYYNEDSSSSQSFAADENSSYFQFFRGIHNDYLGLTARKQRFFKRQCLNILHDLLDEEDSAPPTLHQDCAINLSGAGHDGHGDKSPGVHIVDSYSLFAS